MEKDNYSFENLIHNESFRRWVDGTASQQEQRFWDRWIMKDPSNRALAVRAQKHIAGFSIKPSSRPSQLKVWNQLQEQMEAEGGSYKKRVYATSGNDSLKWIFRVAAGFLLIAMTGLFVSLILNNQAEEPQRTPIVRNEVVTDYGERKTIGLSDGSEIILNAYSSLVYTVDPADSNAVEVFLDGEALFSVAERKSPEDAAFKVRTSAGLVKVMGTRFVVSTRNRKTQVILTQGKVALNSLSGDKQTVLKPGQWAEFGTDIDTVYTKYVNPQVYTSWTTYTLVFDRTPFTDIIERLEDTFGVKVVVREPHLYERKITGSIDNSSLEVITAALSNTLSVPIQVTDKAVYVGRKSIGGKQRQQGGPRISADERR